MTSKNSFSEGGLLRDGMRRNLWCVVLSGLGFIFSLLLPALMTMQRALELHEDELRAGAEQAQRAWQDRLSAVSELLGGGNAGVKFAFVMLAVVCGVSAFAYLHARQKVDFYHSLPVSRTRLFFTNFATGVLCVLPAYLATLAVTIACAYGMGFGGAVHWGEIGGAVACSVILFLLLYALSALAAILCGNTIISLLLLLWIFFSPFAVLELQTGVFQKFFATYLVPRGAAQLFCRVTPIVEFFVLDGGYEYYAEKTPAVGLLLLYLLAAALVTALGCRLFRIRKSERAGTALAFKPAKTPIKVFMCMVAGVAVGLLFELIAGGFWFWPGLVTGTVLFHWIVEIIYAFDFHAIFAKPVHLAVILAALIAGMLCLRFDVAGYDNWIPAENEIEAADVSRYSADEMLRTPENIAAVRRLAEIGVQMTAMQRDGASPEQLGQSFGSYETSDRIEVTYELKGGRSAARKYRLPNTEETKALIGRLTSSEEYKRAKLPLFRFDETATDERRPYLEAYTNAGYPAGVTLRDAEAVRQIVQTLRGETLARAENGAPVVRLILHAAYPDDQYRGEAASNAYVTAADVKTLALLKEYAGVSPVKLSADNTDSLYLDFYYADESRVDVTDRADIDALLENAINRDAMELYYGGWDGRALGYPETAVDAYDCNVYAVIGGETYMLSYPDGKLPTAVLEKYAAGVAA